jgi:methylthioribulose-1-phosphate dehydratase
VTPTHLAEDTETRRADLAAVCRRLYGNGWMPGTSGNVSVRSAAAVLISASGRGKGTMEAADTVLVDTVDGLPLPGESGRPSAETAIHLAVYRQRPEK